MLLPNARCCATRTTLSLSSACAAAFQPLPALLILVRVLYSSDCHTNARTHSTPHVQRAVDASSSTSLSFPLVWMSWSLEEEAEGLLRQVEQLLCRSAEESGTRHSWHQR